MQEDINKLQNNMIKIQTDMEYIKLSLDDNKKDHKDILDTIEKWIDSSEKRFAPKWAADVIKWTGGVVGTSIILYILSKVLI